MTSVHAIFGIEPGTLNTIVQLVLLAVVVIWLSLVWYTYADARRRLDDQLLVGSAVLASLLFPFLGTIVYMIVRPPEYLEDVRERELEVEAAQARLASLDYQLCPHCDAAVGRDFLRCPHCLRKLRDTCGSCSRPLDPDWMICPYCEAEIPGVTPQRRGRRRRAGESEPPPGAGGDDAAYDPGLASASGYGDIPADASGHGAAAADASGYGAAPADAAGYGVAPADASGYGEETAGGVGDEPSLAEAGNGDEPAGYGERERTGYGERSGYEDTVVSQAPPGYEGDHGLEAGTPSEPPPGYGQPRQH